MPTPPGPYGVPGGPRPGGGAAAGFLWALGGALVASAVWAGLVLGAGIGSDDGPGKPRVAYRTVENLCSTVEFAKFLQEYPKKDDDPSSDTLRSRSTDRMYCSLSLEKDGGDDTHYLYATVEVHRDADPTTEFRAQREMMLQDKYEIADAPGLGEEAFLAYQDETDDDYRSIEHELYVRDGGVVFSLSFSNGFGRDGEIPDREATRNRLVEDARTLMDKLRATGASA
jgi:hypothetical protein